MATTEERVSYIEGRLDSLATKADLYKAFIQFSIVITGVVSAGVAFLKLTG